MAASTQKLVSL